jgi:competence protein ComEA
MKEKLSLVLSLIFVAAIVAYWGFSQGSNNPVNSVNDQQNSQSNQYNNKSKSSKVKIKSTTAEKDIVVHIKGAIKNPGDYQVPYGSTVQDLIVVAGGCLDGADTSGLVLNKTLRQNQTIKVPFISSGSAQDSIVNVNVASLEEIDSLPGISKVTAERIINERNKSKFINLDDFKQRLNFSSAKIEKLKGIISF